MSTSPPARPSHPKPATGTKQLLEELDALMQRMLEVPVNDANEARETAEEAPQATETAAGSPVSEQPAPGGPPSQQEIPAPARSLPPPAETSLVTAHKATPELPPPHGELRMDQPEIPGKEARVVPQPGVVPLGGFWPHPALQGPQWRETPARPPAAPPHWSPPSNSRPVQSLAMPAAAVRRPVKNWWLGSLLWSNRAFDRYTAWLGRPGRWLRGPTGRMLLGWLGIGLLAGSLAWGLSNWFDWTW